MFSNNSALSDDEKAVIELLESTPVKLEKRKKALDKVKSGLSDWLSKPLSNFRYQTPDEQFENDSINLIVPINGNDY
jgi:hypothetical protein